ncbi:MAG TPA: RDD family protein [Vicinamibacterales bacterium]|nr:RDD family protein [Vicinamibacterales bacterium]
MKCPKCDYLGFETGDRCKNCGYDFSLLTSPEVEPADLSLKSPEREDVAIGELWLAHANSTPQASESQPQDTITSVESFPLFSPAGEDDGPLIRTPSEPRAPLSVRRSSDLSRSRNASRTPRAIDTGLTLEFAEETPAEIAPPIRSQVVTPIYPEPIIELPARVTTSTSSSADSVASLSRRGLAAIIDHAILFGIDVFVLFSTLRMTALTTDEWRSLPLLPFLAFLLFMKLAYFSAFTAMGGQTIGKMAARIRVVADDQFMMDPARAIKRTLTSVVSLATLGLGLIPALIAPDRRAFHDRVAHTHVVDLPSA